MSRARHDGPNDPNVLDRIAKGARLGLTYDLLAKYAGISRTSLYSWKRMAADGVEEYRAFGQALAEAEAECAVACMARIHAAAKDPGKWQAAAWVMERRFGYVARQEITGADGGPIEVAPALPLADRIARRLGLSEPDASNEPEEVG